MNRKAFYTKVLLTLLIAAWFTGIFSNALYSPGFPGILPGFFPDKLYSLVCHQESAKSFFVSGHKLEVCARCTGIYSGALLFAVIGLILHNFMIRDKKWLLLSFIPMAFDVIFYSAGLYSYSKWAAFSTGLILGSVAILYIFTGIEDYFFELNPGTNVQ